MRKSNLTKILIAILTFSLLLGAIVGISATAADEGEVYLENADVERNVQYKSKTYLLYRVLKSDIKEEDQATLCMQIAKEDGSIVGKITPKEDGDYYVFTTQGVPAKELNTREVVTVMSGSKAISPAITWSVEDYLYARLYADKYADETEAGVVGIGEDDGLDFARRDIYFDLLKYGAEAQKVLAPDAEDKIGDSAFVFADDALATYGRFDEPTKITLRYDDSKTPAGKQFVGWQCDMYDAFGDLIETVQVSDRSVITAEGYVKMNPVFIDRSVITFDGIDALPSTIRTYMSSTKPAVVSFADDKFSLTKTATGDNSGAYWYVNPNTKVDGANTVIFEADFSANITNGASELGYFTIYTGANGGDKVYWAHLSRSNGYMYINVEYVKTTSGGQVSVSRKVASPIKLDGTTYKLTVIFREVAFGENFLEFYADGQLFHATNNFYATTFNDNKNPAKVSNIGSMAINFSNNPAGVMTLDNVSMTQCNLSNFEKLGADDTVIDFDLSSANVVKGANKELNYFTTDYDRKTGSGFLRVTKYATGSGNGMSFDIPVTYAEENANYAVFSFDYYMEDSVTRLDNQIMLGHANYSGIANGSTPVLPSLATSESDNALHKGKWIHVEITYEVLGYAEDGTVNKIFSDITVTNGPNGYNNRGTDEETGVYKNGSSYFKIFGNPGNHSSGGIDVPTVEQLNTFRISLNQNAYGDVRFDNLSFKLINNAGN